MAYIGDEGFLVNTKLREGKQHSQKGTPDFLRETLRLAHQMTDQQLLSRMDSGNDAAENLGILIEDGSWFVIKRNMRRGETKEGWLEKVQDCCKDIRHPREGKTVYIGSSWKDVPYTTVNGEQKTICLRIGYEIKIKTDMDVERFPSGKFDTNELVLELTVLAYNILRVIGQKSLKSSSAPKTKRKVKRRRIRTVISNLILIAGHVKEHARRLILSLGKSNIWIPVFMDLHHQLVLT
jgi:hypothetical protein